MALLRRSPLLVLVALSIIGLSTCGGGSSQPTAHPAISFRTCEKLGDASEAIYDGQRLTERLKANPQNIAKAKELLKPLTIANTLDVHASNEVAGGTVTALFDELDGLFPGDLTKEGRQGEELDVAVVNRFLRYARTRPALVSEPRVAKGVTDLDSLLHGKRADLDLSSCGGGLTTAGELVSDAEGRARTWPALSKRLAALQASLR